MRNSWDKKENIYHCDKLHFPNMATGSHTSHASVKRELDISLSVGEDISPALESGQALAAV